MNSEPSPVAMTTLSDFGTASERSISIRQNLPIYKINVPLAVGSNKVHSIFQNVCRQTNFEVVEVEMTMATAVHKGDGFSFSKMFMNCIPF